MNICSGVQMTSRPSPAFSDVPPAQTDHPGRGDGAHDAAHLDALRPLLMGSGPVAALADTFKALADPTRVRMLDALARAALCVRHLATLIGLSESAVSPQL